MFDGKETIDLGEKETEEIREWLRDPAHKQREPTTPRLTRWPTECDSAIGHSDDPAMPGIDPGVTSIGPQPVTDPDLVRQICAPSVGAAHVGQHGTEQ